MDEIVIVEDEVLISLSYKMILEQNGYTVTHKYRKAVDLIEHIEEIRPALFILDIELIEKPNGIELAKKIRELSDTPILFATGNSVYETIKHIEHISNSELLSKPLNKEDLLSSIRKLIECQKN